MAEWSKALRSGRSPLLRAWVRIPLLTEQPFVCFLAFFCFEDSFSMYIRRRPMVLLTAEWRSGSVLGP